MSTNTGSRKKGDYSLLSEINTEEEWNGLCGREGLIVVDVYSEWSGPCSAMTNFLKKVKLEINDDLLHYATAKCDSIPQLSMFKGSCHIVSVVHGANAPLLGKMIEREIENERMVLAGEKERDIISMEEVVPKKSQILDRRHLYLESENGEDYNEDTNNDREESVCDNFAILALTSDFDDESLKKVIEDLTSRDIIVAKLKRVICNEYLTSLLYSSPVESDSDHSLENVESEQKQAVLLLVCRNESEEEGSAIDKVKKMLDNDEDKTGLRTLHCTEESDPNSSMHCPDKENFLNLVEAFFLDSPMLDTQDLLLVVFTSDRDKNDDLLSLCEERKDWIEVFKVSSQMDFDENKANEFLKLFSEPREDILKLSGNSIACSLLRMTNDRNDPSTEECYKGFIEKLSALEPALIVFGDDEGLNFKVLEFLFPELSAEYPSEEELRASSPEKDSPVKRSAAFLEVILK